jgi:hypothetical protein
MTTPTTDCTPFTFPIKLVTSDLTLLVDLFAIDRY